MLDQCSFAVLEKRGRLTAPAYTTTNRRSNSFACLRMGGEEGPDRARAEWAGDVAFTFSQSSIAASCHKLTGADLLPFELILAVLENGLAGALF
jgi:hypothetical protein